jgi:hypothetical protein
MPISKIIGRAAKKPVYTILLTIIRTPGKGFSRARKRRGAPRRTLPGRARPAENDKYQQEGAPAR